MFLWGVRSTDNKPRSSNDHPKDQSHDQKYTPTKFNLTFYDWSGRSEIKEDIAFMNQAIENNWLVRFEYIDRAGIRTDRVVEPYELQLVEIHWYLIGYRLERQDYRTFKLMRILGVQREGSFIPRPEEEVEKGKNSMEQPGMVTVQLMIDAGVRDQFIERYGKTSVVEVTPDHYLANIELPENSFSYQFLAGLGNKVKILKPQGFIENYVGFLKATIALYK